MNPTVSLARAHSLLASMPALRLPLQRDQRQERVGEPELPLALEARLQFVPGEGPRLGMYVSLPGSAEARDATPLVLVHGIHAAASAAEMQPVFERYSALRPVVALDLPGFGQSQRAAVHYTPHLMANAVVRAVEHLRSLGFMRPVDVMALSLSCEFVARAAQSRPTWFHSLALISPTGFHRAGSQKFEPDHLPAPTLLRPLLSMPLLARPMFRALTTRASLANFLRRAWGSVSINKRLLEYGLLTVRQPGAWRAPLAFLSGSLATRGVAQLYASLPHPVWIAHGVRGDFTGYDGLSRLATPDNRVVDIFGTGAMPHFEAPPLFASRYEAFLRKAGASRN